VCTRKRTEKEKKKRNKLVGHLQPPTASKKDKLAEIRPADDPSDEHTAETATLKEEDQALKTPREEKEDTGKGASTAHGDLGLSSSLEGLH